MKVVVTGHRGFIGSNLISVFDSVIGIEKGYRKKELYNTLDNFNPDVVFHVGGCSNTLETDINYILNLNYLNTKWISDWCFSNNKKIIYSSSASVYGTNGTPSNLYGWSKLLGEDYVLSRGGISLRYFNVYGPGEEHKEKMASMIYQNYKKSKVKLFPNKPTRDFIFIDDVVNANIHALKHYDKLSGNWYEVGTGKSTSFEELFDILKIKYEYLDEKDIPDGYQFNTKSDKNKWMKDWKPNYTLKKGIKKYKNYLDEKS